MKLHHTDSFETDIYVTTNGHIRIQQIIDGYETFVLISDIQANQIKKMLPYLIKFQLEIKNEKIQNEDQEVSNDEG